MQSGSFLRIFLLSLLLILLQHHSAYSQVNCDPSTPSFSVDLSSNPNGTWVSSPPVPRVGNCCGTSPPDKCIEFVITLSPLAISINFSIASGAIPGGAMFYQINCGPPQSVGTPLCLNGPGPYTLTFCKPGNNVNTYAITSIAAPAVSPDDTTASGCSTIMYASGLLVNSSITWTSVFPGATGQYNSYLSCTSACDTVTVTPQPGAPPYIDYMVCGQPVAGVCASTSLFCDTVRVYITPQLTATVTPNPASFCSNLPGILLNGTPGGGAPTYTCTWTNGANGTGSVVANGNSYTATSAGVYSYVVYDQNYPKCPATIVNVPVTVSPAPVINAGPDQTICGTIATLSATVSGATGGIWSGGGGTFSPNNTSPTAVYTPTAAEITNGTVILTWTSTGNGVCAAVSDQVVLHFIPPVNVTLTGPAIICFGQVGSITANVTGGVAPYSYQWSTGQTTQTISNIGPGTYTVTVSSFGNPCTGTATITIPGNPQIVITTSPNNSISCSTTAVISASATGGTGTLNYSWSNGATTPSTAVYTGTYQVTVTDAVGCSANGSVSVLAANSTLLVSVNQPPVLCNGATTTLSAAASGGFGGYSYSWNTGATSPSIVVGAGNYCATVTDGGGCITSACVNVTQESPLNVSIPTPAKVCNGSPATITASAAGGQAPYTYLWNTGQTAQSITQLAGTYTVTATDAIGCTKTATVTITQATPLAATISSNPVSCFGGNNGSASVNASGGTSGYFYSWTPYGGSSSIAGGLVAGTYTVNITDAIGCATTTVVTVNQPNALAASISSTVSPGCYGGNNGSATVNVTGGTPTYFYSWSPTGGNAQTGINLGAGSYVVSITDVNGCTTTAQTTITQPAILSANASSVTNVSCNGGSNGGATISISGGTPGFNFSWAPGGYTGSTVNNLPGGNYTVSVTDFKGCTTQTTVNISQPPVLTAVISGSTNTSCFGGSNGTATVSPSGGTGPYTYLWNSNPVQTSAAATNLPAGTYSATVTDSKGCSVTSAGVTISQSTAISVSVSPSALISCNTTINISASASGGTGTYSYQWSTGASTATITVPTGNYVATVTDGNGCVATGSVSVQAANSTLAASITQPPNICFGSSITIPVNVTGGFGSYHYQWSNGDTTSSITVNAGNYCVTITDGAGCVANACVSVNQNSPLSINITTPSHVCPGGVTNVTAVPSGGQAPYVYQWNTGQSTATITQPVGSYTVTIHDTSGISCTATATVSISNEPQIVIASASTNVSCFGYNNGTATINASGGVAGYTYNWLPSGGTNSTATNLGPGSYTVTVTDALGCTKTSVSNVSQPTSSVSISVTGTNALCFGQASGSATASPSGGNSPYTYYWWQNGDTLATTNGIPAGNYTVTVADVTGCYGEASVTISQPTDIILTDTAFAANCSNSNGSASVFATGGTPGYLYAWSPIGGNAPTANNLPAGNYTVVVTDTKGCQKTAGVTVPLIPSNLVPNFSSTIACPNSVTSFHDLSTVSGDSIVAWAWDFGEPSSGLNNISSNQNPTHSYNSSGTFTVVLTVATLSGCTTSVALPVSVYPGPATGFTVSTSCVNITSIFTDTSSISSGTITSYSWSFGDPGSGLNNASSSQNPTHTYYTAGIYTVSLTTTSNNGCSNSSVKTLTISATPAVSFTASAVCQGVFTQFSDSSTIATGNTISSWIWNFGDGSPADSAQNPAHIYTNGGNYNVILSVTSTSGCVGKDTVTILVNPLPVANFSAPYVCLGSVTPFTNQSTISSGTIASYSWDFGNFTPVIHSQSPNYVYVSAGTFNVSLIVVSAAGCSDTMIKPVNVYPLPSAFFNATDACADSSTHFTDQSTIAGGNSINGWLWSFGDGAPVNSSQNPSHIYTVPGTYNVAMVVTTNWGCVDTLLKPVVVYPSPVVQFFVADSNSCLNACTHFTDSSTISSGSIVNWNWNFGDNSISSGEQNPLHCYTNTGVYSISLTAISSFGCAFTFTHQNYINVYPVPYAEFSFTPTSPLSILEPTINFTNLSDTSATNWVWNFDDPLDPYGSTIKSPTHVYGDTGKYCVTLIVENSYHCVDTATHCLIIEPDFTFFIPNAFSPGASQGLNDEFSGVGSYFTNYQMWVYDRWGNMIFYTNDIEKRWTGRVNNGKEIAQEDVYVYLVKLFDLHKTEHVYKGIVSLIK
jgi:PKD repeat protein